MKTNNGRDNILNDINSATTEAISPGGTVYIGAASEKYEAINGTFFAFTALEAATIDVSRCTTNILTKGASTGDPLIKNVTADITVPAGVTIYGNFLSIELSAGKGIAYYKDMTTAKASF